MTEEWRDIAGFEGMYQISNFGNVKSVSRYVFAGEHANHSYFRVNEKMLKGSLDHKGYRGVNLSCNGRVRRFLVHRLVAQAFIPNPDNLPCVNHKDENPRNNCVDNLEWCTYKYNNEYNGRVDKCRDKISKTLKGRKSNRVLTEEQREHIREGAIRGWKTRRKNISENC